MRLTLCLEGNGEGRVLANINMEEIIAHTNIKDIIRREIHDNVAQEMYCKGIDDFVEKIELKYLGVNPDELYEKYYPREICEQIKEIAKQLKEQICQ